MDKIETITKNERVFVSVDDLIKNLQSTIKSREEEMKTIKNYDDGRILEGVVQGIEDVEESLRNMK